jgi:hypothetical protein
MIEIVEIINFGDCLRVAYKKRDQEPEEPFYIEVDSQNFDLLQIITEIKNYLENANLDR